MGLPLLFNGGHTYSVIGSGGLWGATAVSYNKTSSLTGSGGVHANGAVASMAIFNIAVPSAGLWSGTSALSSAIYNFIGSGGGWASDPIADQPTQYVPTLLGESPRGLRCRFGLVVANVTMIKVKNAYVPAITVCDSQIALRRIESPPLM